MVMRRVSVAVGIGTAMSLVACAGQTAVATEEPAMAFPDLLVRTADTDRERGDRLYSVDVFYGDQSTVRKSAAVDDTWAYLDGFGAGVLGPGTDNAAEVRELTGVDVLAATTLFSVGVDDNRVILVAGNQDTEEISDTAIANGWMRDGDILKIDPPPNAVQGLQFAAQVKLLGDSVMLGHPDSDMTRIAAKPRAHGSLLSTPSYSTITSCLGEPDVGRIVDSDEIGSGYRGTAAAEGPIAVGVFAGEEDEATSTVVCAVSNNPEAVAEDIALSVENDTINNPSDEKLSEWIVDVEISVDGDLVRARFVHAEDTDADSLITMARRPGLPGFR